MPFDIYMPTGTSGHGEHLLRCPSSHSNMSQQSNLFGKLKSKFSGSSSEKSQKLRFATPFGRKDTFQGNFICLTYTPKHDYRFAQKLNSMFLK